MRRGYDVVVTRPQRVMFVLRKHFAGAARRARPGIFPINPGGEWMLRRLETDDRGGRPCSLRRRRGPHHRDRRRQLAVAEESQCRRRASQPKTDFAHILRSTDAHHDEEGVES